MTNTFLVIMQKAGLRLPLWKEVFFSTKSREVEESSGYWYFLCEHNDTEKTLVKSQSMLLMIQVVTADSLLSPLKD